MRVRRAGELLELELGDAALTVELSDPGAELARREPQRLWAAAEPQQCVGREVEGAAPANGQGIQLEIVHAESVGGRHQEHIVTLPPVRCGLAAKLVATAPPP